LGKSRSEGDPAHSHSGWLGFLSEGIQKFLFPESLGVGRFVKIGIPLPELMASFVGVTEIICGALILIGLFTRLACVPLLIDANGRYAGRARVAVGLF
jgi:hypothetical protein